MVQCQNVLPAGGLRVRVGRNKAATGKLGDRTKAGLFHALVISLVVNAALPDASVQCWASDPSKIIATEPTTRPAPDGDADLQRVLAAADRAVDRDQRILLLRSALSRYPGNPQNIVLEFRIGTLLGQNFDVQRGEAADDERSLAIFERIVKTYDHASYYQSDPGEDADSPELMVPRAAILAASTLRAKSHNPQQARVYLMLAMKDLEWTFRRRTAEWLAVPKPSLKTRGDYNSEQASLKRRTQQWEVRRSQALSSEVLGSIGVAVVQAAVRQYGLSYGPQHPRDVARAMGEVIVAFPNTPMATCAEDHIDRAARLLVGQSNLATPIEPATSEAGSKPHDLVGNPAATAIGAKGSVYWPMYLAIGGVAVLLTLLWRLRKRRSGG
jgi:hypothetical protein